MENQNPLRRPVSNKRVNDVVWPGFPEDVRKKFIAHDRTIGLHDVRLSELDLRLQCTETANYEGVLIWKIGEYRERKRQAVDGRILSLYSQPFYTSHYGYKLCARVYLNGDGVGRGTHMSLFFVVMQVGYLEKLYWGVAVRQILFILGAKQRVQQTLLLKWSAQWWLWWPCHALQCMD